MSFTDATPLLDPEKCLEFFKIRRNIRNARDPGHSDFANAPQLQAWGNSSSSSQLVVNGGFETRHIARDFAADIIEFIRGASVPIIWALDSGDKKTYSTSDILKYLVSQILQQNHTLLNERSAALSAARFQSAKTPRDWMNLFGSVLVGLPQLYVILDVDVLEKCLTSEAMTWPDRFRELFSALAARNVRTTVKVAFMITRLRHKSQLGDFEEREVLRIPCNRRGGIRKTTQNNVGVRARRKRERFLNGLLG
jgi:hypothetical protein